MNTARIFEQNPQLTEYFQTSDGQSFYTNDAAKMHAKSLADKTVKHVEKLGEVIELPKENVTEKESSDELNRDELILRYTELYGKAPAKNIGLEKLQARIEEKETELNQNGIADETEN